MTDAQPKLRGRKAFYRKKVRHPMSVLLTPFGHEKLAALVEQSGLSRSDVLETLIREATRIKPAA